MFSSSAPSSVDVQTNFYDGGTGSFLGLFRIAAGAAFKPLLGPGPTRASRAGVGPALEREGAPSPRLLQGATIVAVWMCVALNRLPATL